MEAALRAVSGAKGDIIVSKALRRQPVRLLANRTEPVEVLLLTERSWRVAYLFLNPVCSMPCRDSRRAKRAL